MKRTFIEAPGIARTLADNGVSARQIRAMELEIMTGRGDTISGTGGLKKIRGGLVAAIEHAEGQHVLTTRDVHAPQPPRLMTPQEITRLREQKIRVSQAVFAQAINASVQTVQAWEQGRTTPTGCTMRFLRMLEEKPELITGMLEPA